MTFMLICLGPFVTAYFVSFLDINKVQVHHNQQNERLSLTLSDRTQQTLRHMPIET